MMPSASSDAQMSLSRDMGVLPQMVRESIGDNHDEMPPNCLVVLGNTDIQLAFVLGMIA